MTKNFKPLSKDERQNTYGGWAWLTAAMPSILAAAKWIGVGALGVKMLGSTSGQIKAAGIDAKWDNKEASGSSSGKSVEKHYFYAY